MENVTVALLSFMHKGHIF